jgi:hypothetical protein
MLHIHKHKMLQLRIFLNFCESNMQIGTNTSKQIHRIWNIDKLILYIYRFHGLVTLFLHT